MLTDNRVYLLVGQRGSGKSHYAKRLVENQPGLAMISRDEILVRLTGAVDVDPYSGIHESARDLMDHSLRHQLSTMTGLRLILDCWTGHGEERQSLLRKLREYGATTVTALYFITPLELVNVWFWQKPGIAKMEEMKRRKGEDLTFYSEKSPTWDFQLFHEYASKIDSDGFDQVIRISDPRQELVTLP